jgi:hypothetical protein
MMRRAKRKTDDLRIEHDQRPVVIVDEMAELAAQDPTFGGIYEDARIEEAYSKVVAALRLAYQRRSHRSPPKDGKGLFLDLQSELVLPHEELIRKLVLTINEQQKLLPEDQEKVLAVIDDFIAKMQDVR